MRREFEIPPSIPCWSSNFFHWFSDAFSRIFLACSSRPWDMQTCSPTASSGATKSSTHGRTKITTLDLTNLISIPMLADGALPFFLAIAWNRLYRFEKSRETKRMTKNNNCKKRTKTPSNSARLIIGSNKLSSELSGVRSHASWILCIFSNLKETKPNCDNSIQRI